jgi:integrase
VDVKDLTDQQKCMILESLRGADHILLLLLFETGLEPEELLSLRTADLEMERGELLLHSGQRIPLSTSLKKELGLYLSSRPGLTYLLEGRCGKPMTVKWKRCVLEKLLSRANRSRAEGQDQGLCPLPAQGRPCSTHREV